MAKDAHACVIGCIAPWRLTNTDPAKFFEARNTATFSINAYAKKRIAIWALLDRRRNLTGYTRKDSLTHWYLLYETCLRSDWRRFCRCWDGRSTRKGSRGRSGQRPSMFYFLQRNYHNAGSNLLCVPNWG